MIRQFKLMREDKEGKIIIEGVEFLSNGLVALNWISRSVPLITGYDSIKLMIEKLYDDYIIVWEKEQDD